MTGSHEKSGVSALSALGVQFGRHTGAYAGASGITMILALVQVAIVTRYLDPAAFGKLALLLFWAGLLTHLYNLGTLQGILGRVYGLAGGDDDDDVGDDEGPAEVDAGRKRQALGAGIVLIALIALTGSLLLAPMAGGIANMLLRDSGDADLVLLAILCGGLGAVWRIVGNIPRMERQPRRYIWVNSSRAILVIAAVTPLVVAGKGVGGVLIGIAIGSTTAIAIGLYASRASWVPHFELFEARQIYKRGAYLIPIIVSFYIVQNVDVFALSRYVDTADVGRYRLAGRIAVVVSYASGAFFFAWSPLRRGIGFAAAKEERGRDVEGKVLAYYCVLCASLLVLMTVSADFLVKVAPSSYASAAPLVPLLGGAFVAHGLLVAMNRTSRFPKKRVTYVATVVSSAGIFVIAAMALIPRLGAPGSALAVMLSFLPGAAWMFFRNQLGPNPTGVESNRLVALLLVTLLAIAAAEATAVLGGAQQALAQAAILAAFFPALVLTGAIPRNDLRSLRRIAPHLLGRPRTLGLDRRLAELPADRAGELWALTRGGRSLEGVAHGDGTAPAEHAAELVSDLRLLLGSAGESSWDAAIGLHLFTKTTHADHDVNARSLQNAGVSAQELGQLELAVQELRSVPNSRWPAAALAAGKQVPQTAPTDAAESLRVLKTEIREVGRGRAKTMMKVEKSFGRHMAYVIQPGTGESEAMIIAHASSRPGVPERYSYVGVLTGIDCPVVFLRAKAGYFFGLNPDEDEETADESARCQEYLRTELGVEKENVISVGGSAGGVRALAYAVQLGHGHAILGAPLVMIGDFLLDPTGGRGARKKLARTISGGIDEDARERLNNVILDRLSNPGGETDLHLFISPQDELYQHSLRPIEDACRGNPDLLHLDLTLGSYAGHSQHRDHFRNYLRAKAAEVLASIDRPPVRSELTISA